MSSSEEIIEKIEEKEFMFIQEDREKVLKKKQHNLISNKFLPIVGITIQRIKSILKKISMKLKKQTTSIPI